MKKMATWLFVLTALFATNSLDAKDDWQSDLHKWAASSQTDSNCKVRYVTGIYRPDLGDKPVWGFMTESMFRYFSKDGVKLAPSICPVTRTTKDTAEYRVLFSVSPMKTVSQTTHGSETQTTTQPFNANVSYSDGSTATIQGEQTSTVVVPTETTISRSSVAVYMYTYRVTGDQLELLSTDNIFFSRVAASGSGTNAAGAELGAGIGNLVRKSKDRHRTDKLCQEALKAILAEELPNAVAQEGKLPNTAALSVDTHPTAETTPKTLELSSAPAKTTFQSPEAKPAVQKIAEPSPARNDIAIPPRSAAEAVTEGISSVTSEPDGANIFIDSVGSGHTPALLKLKPGRHTVQVVYSGYRDWVSEVEVKAGSIVNVTATLQK